MWPVDILKGFSINILPSDLLFDPRYAHICNMPEKPHRQNVILTKFHDDWWKLWIQECSKTISMIRFFTLLDPYKKESYKSKRQTFRKKFLNDWMKYMAS